MPSKQTETMRKWKLRTNRHPTTYGRPWGWIEGPEERIYWNDDPAHISRSPDSLSYQEAKRRVREHNEKI